MNYIWKALVVLSAVFITANSFAATDDRLLLDSSPGYINLDVQGAASETMSEGDGSQSGGYFLSGQGGSGQNLQPIPSFQTQAVSPARPSLPPQSSSDLKKQLQDPKSSVPRPKLLVRAEPGDGLVTVSWKLAGLVRTTGVSPVRYIVMYGDESGHYKKKIDVGLSSEYRIRELTNHKPCFVKVQAVAKVDGELEGGEESAAGISIFSSELVVTPIPAEEQGSRLEKSFSDKVVTLHDKLEKEMFKRELSQFGYEFFRNPLPATTSFENVPVGSDYVVGPGDSLRIELWGTIQGRYEVTVDRNGEIFLPRVGSVKVWGLGYNDAKEAVHRAVSRYFKGFELNMTLGKLRSVQVFVVGEVEMPGTYSVSSLSTVINALSLAGGPTKNGSLRNISVSRNGKPVQDFDLYDFFLSGDRSKDIRLQSGDTIFVPVVGPVAAVAGEVKRPAIYELKGKTTLPQLLAMAGGIAASGDNGRIQVERIEGNSARIVLDYEQKAISSDAASSVEILDRDMLKVFPVYKAFRKVVTLDGNVVRPGEYQYREGMRVRDLLPGFESLLPDSYLPSAEIVRLVPPDFHREPVAFNLKNAIEGVEADNLPLREQDTIRVFARGDMGEKPTVAINGLVMNPGTFDFFPKMTVRDLVTAAGSLKRNAFLDNAELTRVSISKGEARAERKNFNLQKALAGDPEHNFQLQPDDTVIVRGLVEWAESVDTFVVLKGEVRFPGVYSITKGEKLSSVVARAGGFTEKAYLKGAKFTRKSVKESQQKRMDEVINRTEHEILQKQGELASVASSQEELLATKSALDGLLKSLDKLKALKPEGRIVIRLSPLGHLEKTAYDLELVGGDVLEIPRTPSVVHIMGQVYNPTSFVFMPNSNVNYYLKNAGGPTREAEEDDMYVIKADGSVNSRHNSSFGISWDESSRSWNFGSFMSRYLDPGDTLVVPQKLERIAWLREIKDITTIVSQIALTAGTVLIGLK